MSQVPDFTDSELWIIRTTLKERYGKDVETQLADVELRLDPGAREVTSCPAVYWSERGANFVLCKVGEKQYHAQFYYGSSRQYGTGRDRYDELGDCVTTLLQVQADHERERAGVHSKGMGDRASR